MIAVVGRNWELGKGGDLAFTGKGELGYFRDVTMGHKILMGVKTYESLPRRLEGREYYVATRGDFDAPEWVNVVQDLTGFLEEWREADEEMMVIGGGQIYAFSLPYADRLYLTEVDGECPGANVFFPEFDKGEWTKSQVGEGEYDDGLKYRRYIYIRK